MDKKDICDILNDIGVLLQLKGENFFKSKAYFEGARTIELMEDDLGELIKNDKLKDVKGIGKALTQKITELYKTGELKYYTNLKNEVPEGLVEMLKIPNLGAKKIQTIYKELEITNISELEDACVNNKLIELPGFAKKTQEKILEGIRNIKKYNEKTLYSTAEKIACEILDYIKSLKSVARAEVCGSIRRKKEIVKDIDILVSSISDEPAKKFKEHELVESIIADGKTKVSVVLKGSINADLRIVSDEEFPYALHHFTGSREHNTKMRHISKQMGLKMNEYGLFNGDKLVKCNNEKEIFNYLGMEYIEPELREDTGEIECAQKNEMPELISFDDIKGFIHTHTVYSDGENTVENIVKHALKKGYKYILISDHSKSAYYANGMNEDSVKKQHEEIDRINESYSGKIKVLKGIELDILLDGNIDYSEKILSEFDCRIASVHSSFGMSIEKMTERIVTAMKNKFVNILGHPTGRILLSREAYKLDIIEIIKTAKEENVILEINSVPERLDLAWKHVKSAKDIGCKFVISADAHSYKGFNNLKYGINMARKGWLESKDVVNTYSINEFLGTLKK